MQSPILNLNLNLNLPLEIRVHVYYISYFQEDNLTVFKCKLGILTKVLLIHWKVSMISWWSLFLWILTWGLKIDFKTSGTGLVSFNLLGKHESLPIANTGVASTRSINGLVVQAVSQSISMSLTNIPKLKEALPSKLLDLGGQNFFIMFTLFRASIC